MQMLLFPRGAADTCMRLQAGMIPIQMELGGKDACIICADADLELASKNIVKVSSSGPHRLPDHPRCCTVDIVLAAPPPLPSHCSACRSLTLFLLVHVASSSGPVSSSCQPCPCISSHCIACMAVQPLWLALLPHQPLQLTAA